MKSNRIICPYCEYKLTDDDMFNYHDDLFRLASNEEDTDISCPTCEKEFRVEGSYTPIYITKKAEDCEN